MSTATESKPPALHPDRSGVFGLWLEGRRFLKFCLVGLSNGALDFITLAIIVFLFDPQTTPALIAANSFAFFVGSVNSFTWNSRLTFGTPRPYLSRWFALFILISVGGLILSNVSLLTFRWFFEAIGLEGRAAILAAKLPGAIILASYSYLSYRKLFLGSAGGRLLALAVTRLRHGSQP
jgi:putative flippase GtrA